MKKIVQILVVTTLFCFSGFICSMEHVIQNPPLPTDVVMLIARECQPHEKNNFMKVCIPFHACLTNNKDALLLANPSTVSEIDKAESLFNYVRSGNEKMVFYLLDTAKINPNIKNILGLSPLQYAQKEKHKAIMELLCKYGAKVEEEPQIHPLHEAIYNGDVEMFKTLLSNINMNIVQHGMTPLHIAVHEGNTEIVRLLLNALKFDGNAVTKRNSKGESSIWIAAQKGHADIVKLLIRHGANDLPDNNGVTALYIALKNGHPCCAAPLIEWSTFYNKSCGNDKATPLHIASEYGYLDVVQLLTQKLGLNVNEQNKNGETPLFLASANGHADVVELLLDAKANVDKVTLDGLIPLYVASKNNQIDIVKLLIKAKADIDKGNKDGCTPLHVATHYGYTNIVTLLIETKADINKGEITNGLTPLHAASQYGHIDIVRLLIDAQVDVNKESNDGWIPLHAAAQSGYTDIVKLLIEAHADVNKGTKSGSTPLHKVAATGNRKIANILLCAGADVNKANNVGITPLHLASEHSNIDMVMLLLNAGADITCKTIKFRDKGILNVLDFAQRENHYDIESFLKNHIQCMTKLVKEGASAAFELALELDYDSNILYNNILSLKAHGRSLLGSLGKLSLDELRNELSPLKSDIEFLDQYGNEIRQDLMQCYELKQYNIEELDHTYSSKKNNQNQNSCSIQ